MILEADVQVIMMMSRTGLRSHPTSHNCCATTHWFLLSCVSSVSAKHGLSLSTQNLNINTLGIK